MIRKYICAVSNWSLVSLIHQIGQAYAAEYGLTKERVAGMVAEQRREQERMEAELLPEARR